MPTLNARQEAFVRHYVAGEDGVRGNATKSAAAAGYAVSVARVTGGKLMHKPQVKAAIDAMRAEALEAAGVTLQDWSALVPEAQDTLVQVMRGGVKRGAEVRRKAANDILDRALGKVPTRMQLSGELTIDALLAETDDDD